MDNEMQPESNDLCSTAQIMDTTETIAENLEANKNSVVDVAAVDLDEGAENSKQSTSKRQRECSSDEIAEPPMRKKNKAESTESWCISMFMGISPLVDQATRMDRRIQVNWEHRDDQPNREIVVFGRDNDQNRVIYGRIPASTLSGSVITSVRMPEIDEALLTDQKYRYPYWIGYLEGDNIFTEEFLDSEPTWMYNCRETLGPLRLVDAAIPGTHDSTTDMPFNRNPADLNHVLDNFVNTQEETIFTQLMMGVRYLDIRVMYTEISFSETDDCHFWCHHQTLPSRSLFDVLQNVKRFLKLGTNEIVIVDFHEFTRGFNRDRRRHHELVTFLENELFEFIIPPNIARYGTFNDIWETKKNIFITYNDKEMVRLHSDILGHNNYHAWGNTMDYEDLVGFFAHEIEQRKGTTEIWVACAEFTETFMTMTENPSDGLRHCADIVNVPISFLFAQEEWMMHINIVSMDYFMSSNILKICLEANSRKRPPAIPRQKMRKTFSVLESRKPFADSDSEVSSRALGSVLQSFRILVVGGGEIGFQTLKTLLAFGFRSIDVIDHSVSVITPENPTDESVFRRTDDNKNKAIVLAEIFNEKFPGAVTSHAARIQEQDSEFFRNFHIVIAAAVPASIRLWLNGKLYTLLTYTDGVPNPESIVPMLDLVEVGLHGVVRTVIPSVTACIQCNLRNHAEIQLPFASSFGIKLPRCIIDYVTRNGWNEEFGNSSMNIHDPTVMNWIISHSLARANELGVTPHRIDVTEVRRIVISAKAKLSSAIAAIAGGQVWNMAQNTWSPFENVTVISGIDSLGGQSSYTEDMKDDCINCSPNPIPLTFKTGITLIEVIDYLKTEGGYKLDSPSISSVSNDVQTLLTEADLQQPLQELGITEGGDITVADDSTPKPFSFRIFYTTD